MKTEDTDLFQSLTTEDTHLEPQLSKTESADTVHSFF